MLWRSSGEILFGQISNFLRVGRWPSRLKTKVKMINKNMIVYYLMLSQKFPSYHKLAGQPTSFRSKLLLALSKWSYGKIHTIRANYFFWEKRFEKISQGEACLSIRQWEGLPYKSKQVEIIRLTSKDGIGIQRLSFSADRKALVDGIPVSLVELAEHDGLSLEAWENWFSNYDCSKDLAIIHFTSFRYE